jgi:hypothetical protein
MRGEQSPAEMTEKPRTALEMFGLGESILREKLRRTHPDASAAEIEAMIDSWLARHPGAEHGDAPGKPRKLSG